MISKEDAKKEVKKLVDLYERYKTSGDIKNFEGKEQNTKTTFILPLFKALGWDVHNEKNVEVVSEERVLKGAVDYAFRISGQNKFFVEAKPIGSELKEHVTQAIEYGVNSGNAWVVLTSFESIIIFNCEWKEKDWWKNALFGRLEYKDYLSNFDMLWLLSKESIASGGLDEWATRVGKKVPRTPIDKELLSKFLEWRLKLSKDISSKQKYSTEETDEFVQKLLIRLLFIKNCEDRDFETNYKLLPVIQAYKTHKKGVLKLLRHIFDYYDETYDSSIFENGEVDKISFDESLLSEILNGLHFTSDGLRYNFNVIPSDVMGRLYEQYLGHILKKTPQRAKLKEGKAHRKEQGIYYTPTYIVDYIVRNTLGELLKGKKVDASKIRVLDPACGSGSFLVKAFDVLNEHYSKDKMYGQKTLAGYSTKERILKDNIFGVDLDKQAVEIAQLNLLLRIAEKGQKLPLLKQNIKIGNSLIDDEKVAGDKAFKWGEQFKDIMKEGGFDVVVGNPPYGAELSKEEQSYLTKVYEIGSTDTAILFIKKSFEFLKENGRLGFIVPKALCFASNYKNIRDFIWDNIETIVDCGKVWKEVKLEQVIFILSKGKKIRQYSSYQLKKGKIEYIGKISKSDAEEFGFFLNGVSSEDVELAKKIKSKSVMLNDIAKNQRGAILQKFVSDNGELAVIGGAQVQKLGVIGIKGKINKSNIDSEQAYIKDNSILVQRIVAHIENPIDHIQITCAIPKDKRQIMVDTINQITLNEGVSQEFVWCLLNSKLVNWYAYRFIFGKAIRTMQFDNPTTERLPIKIIPESQQQPFIKLVDKMLSLNKHLNEIGDKKTDEVIRLKEEIKKTDAEIDELVYKIYGITEEEKKVIEESLK